MGNCNDTPIQIQTSKTQNNVEEVDIVKTKLKITRDKIDSLLNNYESEQNKISSLILNEKTRGLPNKAKAKELLKQQKQYRNSISALMIRRNIVINKIRDIQQLNLDKQMIQVLAQTNTFMKQINQEIEQKKSVLEDTKNNQYISPFNETQQEDPEVQKLYKQLQAQVNQPVRNTKINVKAVTIQQNNLPQNNSQKRYVYS